MLKNKNSFSIIILGICIALIIPNLSNFYKKGYVLFNKKPRELKNYAYLNDFKSNTNFKVSRYTSMYPEKAFRISDSIICFSTRNEDSKNIKKSSWYKVNDAGKIIDSLSIKDEYLELQGSYLISVEKEYYLTWLLDGDIMQKPFNLINEGNLVDEIIFKNETKNAVYSIYFYKTDSILEKDFVVTFYFKEGTWCKIYTETRFIVNSKDIETSLMNFKTIDEVANLDYFYKQEWNGHWFPDFKIYLNGKPTKHWRGIGYYTIPVNNKSILLKRWGLNLSTDKNISTPDDMLFYENDLKTYLLISEVSDTSKNSEFVLMQYE